MIIGKDGSDIKRVKLVHGKDNTKLNGLVVDYFNCMQDVEDHINSEDIKINEPVPYRAVLLKDKLILLAGEMDLGLQTLYDEYTFDFKDIILMCKTIRKINRGET